MKNKIKSFFQIEHIRGKNTIKELELPINFNLIVTKKCNASCVHCCANADKSQVGMDKKSLDKIIEVAKKNNLFYFVITGGEPLMYEHIWYLFDKLNDNFGVILNTNGTLITKFVAKKLSKYNISNIHVSLDASTEDIYSKQRGSSTSLNEVLKGIKNLTSYGNNVSTKLIITQINKDDIENVIKLSISLGVKRIVLSWFKSVGRGKENENSLEIKKDVETIMRKIYNLKKKYEAEIIVSLDNAQCFPFLINKIESISYRKLCGDYFCRIDLNGDVYPCPFLNIKLGNIFEDDLIDIWQNQKLKELRHYNLAENLEGSCIECSHRSMCTGGCKANSLTKYGNLKLKDPLCWIKNDRK